MSSTPESLQKIFGHVDANRDGFIENLAEAIRIKSVSASPSNREDVVRMMNFFSDKLRQLGALVELADIGMQALDDGSEIRLPPVILGSLGNDPKKKTVLAYCHLDVQPAAKEDGWDYDPFDLTRVDGRMYGRGTTDDKGPAYGWLHALQSYQKCGLDIPANVKFCFEGMEESGSKGLDELLISRRETPFFQDIDFVCISDNFWLSNGKPALTYGLRGMCYFGIDVECAEKDLHSGVYGGTVFEAMADLIYLMSTLIDKEGKILVEGIMDQVLDLTDEELARYKDLDFKVSDYKTEIGTGNLITGDDKVKTLMAKWRFPSLSIHGIQGAFADEGAKTVIPRKVRGKFSIRTVPNQTPDHVASKVRAHLERRWAERGSTNKMSVHLMKSGRCWLGDVTGPNYSAGRAATKMVYGVDPDLTRLGGSIPVTITFEEVIGKEVMLLPMGGPDDGAHSQNEKMDERNFIEGTKLIAAYLHELGRL